MTADFDQPKPAFTNKQMLDCAEREIGKRKHFYPLLVGRRKMTQQKADYEIGCMETIAELLRRLVAYESKGAKP